MASIGGTKQIRSLTYCTKTAYLAEVGNPVTRLREMRENKFKTYLAACGEMPESYCKCRYMKIVLALISVSLPTFAIQKACN